MNNVQLKEPPLFIKNPFDYGKYFTKESCNVSVLWCVYDKRKKIIIAKGSSRPCGCNHNKYSIHAEVQAINYCRKLNKSKYDIYIWRYTKGGDIKPMVCCSQCTKIAKKYNYLDKIYTFENDNICSAIISNPPLSHAYEINK